MRSLFPGERRVWLVAGVLGVALAAVIGYELLLPRDYFTGTNSVRTRSVVAQISGGDRLCIRGLAVPAGTGRVELDAVGAQPRPALLAFLDISGKRSITRLPAWPGGRSRKFSLPFARRLQSPAMAPGRLCVETRGKRPLVLGGMLGVQDNDVRPTLNGEAQDFRVAVWFRPPAGDRRSLLSLWPQIARRAALFRPGIVGPWLYWLVLAAALPGLMYTAFRLLAQGLSGESTRPRSVLLLALVAFGNAGMWAVITPAFDAPDEYDHYAYAEYLSATGRAPCQDCNRRPRSTDEASALDAVRIFSYIEASDGRPPWLQADERRWKISHSARDLRSDDGGGATTAATHSPVYYALTIPAYRAVGSASVFTRLTAMRFVSAALGAATAVLAFLAARELLPARSQRYAVVAGLLVAFQPMFAFISGAVNNDVGVNAAAALLIYLLIRGVRRGVTVVLGVLIGVLLVLTPLMKATGYALFPAALIALMIMIYRNHRRGDVGAWCALTGAFVLAQVGWTFLSSSFDRSTFTTPSGALPGSEGPVAQALSNPIGFGSYFWQVFFPRLPFMTDLHQQAWPAFDIYVKRGWGAFGWYAIGFPTWVYIVIVVAMAAIGTCTCITLWRMRGVIREGVMEMVVLVVVIAGVIGAVEASFYSELNDRTVVAEQGRYAFTAILPLALVGLGGCFAFGAKWAPWLATSLVGAMVALSVAAQLIAFRGFYT